MTDPADEAQRSRLGTAYFHHVRSASQQKPNPGVDKIFEAMKVRAREERGSPETAR